MAHDSIKFYDSNPDLFARTTIDLDMSAFQDRFLSLIRDGADVLDFGCGAGRDSKYFIEKGCKVKAVDGSAAMCRHFKALTGESASLVRFQDFEPVADSFDGIWASASLLHLDSAELPSVLSKLHSALRRCGILYCSFKYGTGCRVDGERYYTDMDERSFDLLLRSFENRFEMIDRTISEDLRPDRTNEKWLNVFLQKH